MILVRVAMLLFFLAGSAMAMDPVDYLSDAEAQRHKALAAELRCVMCQNQSIADSNAPIARDLRNEVLKLMREGKSDDQIKEYLVARYSEFVLYQPPMRGSHWLLWIGPFALLAMGAGAVVYIIRRKRPITSQPPAEHSEEW